MIGTLEESKVLPEVMKLEDYRSFLRTVIQLSSRNQERCNYAAFARKAGFSSRSFLTQVVDGKRRLTSKSFPKVESALPISPRLKSYFQLLAAREETELNFEALSIQEIENRIASLRNKFKLDMSGQENREVTMDSVFMAREMLECYAAIGSSEVGASLEDIANRTGLPADLCARVLKHFTSNKVVSVREGKYFAENPHLIFNGLGEHTGFRECYLQTLGELNRKARAQFRSDERAFFTSVFSVERQHLPKLKKRLWEVVNEFVESNEAKVGDSVGKLLVGFYT